jgi:hypothetical protein
MGAQAAYGLAPPLIAAVVWWMLGREPGPVWSLACCFVVVLGMWYAVAIGGMVGGNL